VKIKVTKEKCSGCGLCEVICSLSHLGIVDKNKSAVRIIMDELGDSIHTPKVCLQCKKMKCLEEDLAIEPSLDIERERKKFIWESTKRAELCPFDGCFLYENRVYHCDLCGGDPQCIKVCTQGALTLTE
jgi:carbon-monoxide dehydrogenase iron sulfur subunit